MASSNQVYHPFPGNFNYNMASSNQAPGSFPPQLFSDWKTENGALRSWGTLISSCPIINTCVSLYGKLFRIGKGSCCELPIREDTSISDILCQFKCTVQEDGTIAIFIEGVGLGCTFYNGHYLGLRDVIRVKDGDEIDLGTTLRHRYTIVLNDGNYNQAVRGKVWQFDVSSAELWLGTSLLPLSPVRTIESPWDMPDLLTPPTRNDANIQQVIYRRKLAPPPDMPHEFISRIEAGETNRKGRHFGADVMQCTCTACSVERAFIEDQIKHSIVQKENYVTFANFPYYLGQNTKCMLIESTIIYLKRKAFTNHTVELRNLSPRLLLSGPAGTEVYQEMLVKALANHFGVKLLIFDISTMHTGLFAKDTELLKGDQRPKSEKPVDNWPSSMSSTTKALFSFHQGTASNSQAMPKQEALAAPYVSAAAASEKNSFQRGDPEKNVKIHPGYKSPQAPLWPSIWQLHGRLPAVPLFIHLFFEVLTRESKNSPMILLMKNVEKLIIDNLDMYAVLKSKLTNLAEGIVVICSHTEDDDIKEMDSFGRPKQSNEPSGLLSDLFQNEVNIQIPQDEAVLADWKHMLQYEVERHKTKENQHRKSEKALSIAEGRPMPSL